jgi:hypothetical protein
MVHVTQSGVELMPFRPDYRQAERDRAKELKKDEQLRRREPEIACRKALQPEIVSPPRSTTDEPTSESGS